MTDKKTMGKAILRNSALAAGAAALLLAAGCSTGVDHSRDAECGRINSRVMLAPAPGGGDNFLTRNSADQRADAQRARAQRLGCN